MRIALVHSYYRSSQPSGENLVVDYQAKTLRAAGHEVAIIARHSDQEASGSLAPVTTALRVTTGTGYDPTRDLQEFSPDIVHIHNLFPNFGTRWLDRWPGPVAATLHNYRALCANALLLRDGALCTQCPDGKRWSGVRHACYRDSRLASLPLSIHNRRGPTEDPVIKRADRIVVLSPRAREIYLHYSVPEHKLRMIPNGIDPIPVSAAVESPSSWLAVGRLSEEKGWGWLVDRWPKGVKLDIVGDGPMRMQLEQRVHDSIRLVGHLDNVELLRRMPHYRGAVFGGIAPEGCPLVAVEALASGLPLLSRLGGAAADMVERWQCGHVFTDRQDLATFAVLTPTATERNRARHVFDDNFTTSRWLESTLAMYDTLLSR